MTNELMELIATITGYAVIFSVCVFVITMGVYYTIHRVIDALKVRNTFIAMKKQRNKARTAIDKI